MRRYVFYKISFIFLALFLSTSPAQSYDPERAKSNLASDFSDCAAYYFLASETLKNNGKEEDARKTFEVYQSAFIIAVDFSNQKVTEARIKLSLNEQKELIDNNWSNFAILIEKYGNSCKELLENPEKRILYWLEKE